MRTCPVCQATVDDSAQFCGNCGEALSSVPSVTTVKDSFVGKCIDKKYYVRELIASGGMGEVYLAIQKPARQEVAIKKLHEEYYRDKAVVERFMNEAHSYARIAHPNAVKLYDLLNINGQICIVMEFVRGRTLTSYIESGYVFSTRQIIDICLQLADALATVHQAGIIHRDLKTENIMLMETIPGRFCAKILDFGIAKIKDRHVENKTQQGILVGTPEFMSPEQCYGQDIDHRSDIYSFGIIMYVMVCSRLPFICDTAMGLLQKQVHEPTPPCSRPDGSEVLPGFDAIIQKCMMKSPDDRYQSFAEVITDLECLQEHRQTSIATPVKSLQSSTENPSQSRPSKLDVHATEERLRNSVHYESVHFSIDRDESIELDDIDFSDDVPALSASGLPSIQGPAIDGPAEDEDDGDGFSLGDMDLAEEEDEPHAAVAPKSSGHGGRIAAIVVVLLLGLGAFVWLVRSGKILADADLPAFLHPAATEAPVTEPGTPSEPDVADVAPAPNPVDVAAVQPVAKPDPEPIPEPEPVPPCMLMQRETMERGMQLVLLARADSLLNEGKLKEGADLLKSAESSSALLSEDLDRLRTLINKQSSLQEALTAADKARKRQNCDTIATIIAGVPEEATGVRSQLDKIAHRCKADFEAPPATL